MCLLGFRRVCSLCALSFLLSSIRLGLSSSSSIETILRCVNFLYPRFHSAAYLDATELFQSWISEAFQPIRGILARYLQLCNWDPVCDRFATTPSNKDLGGLMAIEYGDHTPLTNLAIYLTVNRMTSPLIGLASCTPLQDTVL